MKTNGEICYRQVDTIIYGICEMWGGLWIVFKIKEILETAS